MQLTQQIQSHAKKESRDFRVFSAFQVPDKSGSSLWTKRH